LRVLILYTELAGYVLGNFKRFLDLNSEAQMLVVHYPVNPEAPFNFNSFDKAEFVEFNENSISTIAKKVIDFNPDIVLCSGWGNKHYIQWVKSLRPDTKRVICFDNQWKASLKQIILSTISKFTFLKMFSYAWVPGLPQRTYALKLGFKSENIFTGLYPADSELFKSVGMKKLSLQTEYPKVFLSVARYIPQKDLPTMWEAFIEANNDMGNLWTMKCIGFGEDYDKRIINPFIAHLGFKQPSEMENDVLNAGVYVLPSIYEPWGVAVHEMALSALPMVLSDKVGAATMFLNKSNGFSFSAGDKAQLKAVFKTIMALSDQQLWDMAGASHKSGLQLSSDNWANTLTTILEN
jgi:glycosyltransferase involved in cell wall biosynthesis